MIGVLTHHWAKADNVQAARKLLDRNGVAQSRFAGFDSRLTLLARDDPTKITTVVLWQSDETYDAWRASPQRTAAMDGAEALWARAPGVGAVRGRRLMRLAIARSIRED